VGGDKVVPEVRGGVHKKLGGHSKKRCRGKVNPRQKGSIDAGGGRQIWGEKLRRPPWNNANARGAGNCQGKFSGASGESKEKW